MAADGITMMKATDNADAVSLQWCAVIFSTVCCTPSDISLHVKVAALILNKSSCVCVEKKRKGQRRGVYIPSVPSIEKAEVLGL
jgi:hypothetical protein